MRTFLIIVLVGLISCGRYDIPAVTDEYMANRDKSDFSAL